MRWLAALLTLALFAGCTSPAAQPEIVSPNRDDPAATPDASPSPTASPAPSPSASPSPSPSPAPAPNGAPNGTPNATANAPQWASAASAKIRPGIQIVSTTGQCTSNFVFTSLDNKTAYIGLAAHCVGGLKVGDVVDIGPGVAKGKIAYSSWFITQHQLPDATGADIPNCPAEKNADVCQGNDFALVEIDAATRAMTNPAMLHFGGPTALASSAAVQDLEKVITYGNSGLRLGFEQTSPHEGYVTEKTSPWTTTIVTAPAGVPGDSGSGVLTGDGRALGVLVTITTASSDPFNPPASNGVTSLDLALAWAAEHGGPKVQLATAPLENGGLLPAI